jgi:HK97 family phage prohead protease
METCMLAANNELLAQVFGPRTKVEPDGTVEGYASLFGAVDQARDMVMPGAFRETLRLRGVNRIPMLFQHDPAEPVGIWLELTEDSRGLYARGKLIPEVRRGRELLALLREGAIDGLSIGFRTVRGRIDPRSRIRKLDQVDLWEISIVTFPLLAGARVRAVKEMGAPSRPISHARARAEREFGALGPTPRAPEPLVVYRKRPPRTARHSSARAPTQRAWARADAAAVCLHQTTTNHRPNPTR